MPSVVAQGESLLLEVLGGADALHDPRRFAVPLREDHLDALRSSLRRHLLLHAALLPLCVSAGIRGSWDESAAAALLDPILLGTPQEVDAVLREVRVDRRLLVAHQVSLDLLTKRRYFDAAQSATTAADWARARKHLGP